MPKAIEKRIKARGGVVRWRIKKVDGKSLRCAITKKAGKRGGKTICYPIAKSKRRK